jgi:hypothetical protein
MYQVRYNWYFPGHVQSMKKQSSVFVVTEYEGNRGHLEAREQQRRHTPSHIATQPRGAYPME